jgi:hypothetical protein
VTVTGAPPGPAPQPLSVQPPPAVEVALIAKSVMVPLRGERIASVPVVVLRMDASSVFDTCSAQSVLLAAVQLTAAKVLTVLGGGGRAVGRGV